MDEFINGDKNMCEDDKNEKIKRFYQEFHNHGLQCGLDISKLANDMHPNAIAIVPLYRSCVVIEQSDEEKKEGIATMHTYADPHWMGQDITIETLQSEDFHAKFIIQGLREGPDVRLVNANTYQKMIGQMQKEEEIKEER
jgi:predicted N-formylglutamate amidohydrolase